MEHRKMGDFGVLFSGKNLTPDRVSLEKPRSLQKNLTLDRVSSFTYFHANSIAGAPGWYHRFAAFSIIFPFWENTAKRRNLGVNGVLGSRRPKKSDPRQGFSENIRPQIGL